MAAKKIYTKDGELVRKMVESGVAIASGFDHRFNSHFYTVIVKERPVKKTTVLKKTSKKGKK